MLYTQVNVRANIQKASHLRLIYILINTSNKLPLKIPSFDFWNLQKQNLDLTVPGLVAVVDLGPCTAWLASVMLRESPPSWCCLTIVLEVGWIFLLNFFTQV